MMIGETIGRYRVLDKLGEGGMGEAFLARDTTREFYADMLMERNVGADRARAATLYAEAADNCERIGLVLYASRLAEKRARLNLA